VTIFQHAGTVLRAALGLMFFLTASAHWGKRRRDPIRMVPPILPRPDLLVTVTGLLEISGATGLCIPSTARAAGICLALLLVALFPANIHAAREKLTIAGRPVQDTGTNGHTNRVCSRPVKRHVSKIATSAGREDDFKMRDHSPTGMFGVKAPENAHRADPSPKVLRRSPG
jgi:uncharacterized membrane protein